MSELGVPVVYIEDLDADLCLVVGHAVRDNDREGEERLCFKVETLIKDQVTVPGNPELFVRKISTLDREHKSLIIVVVVPET